MKPDQNTQGLMQLADRLADLQQRYDKLKDAFEELLRYYASDVTHTPFDFKECVTLWQLKAGLTDKAEK